MPDSQPPTVIIPLDEVRTLLAVSLATMPRHVLRALWDPRERLRDEYRRQAAERLTGGWSNWTITRPTCDHDVARVLYAEAEAAYRAGNAENR